MTAPVIGASTVAGPISPGEVLARAQFWTTSPPPTGYDQGGSTRDPDGKFYRSDCSGFVSMCWHLAGSETTASLPGITQMIDPALLQPGDVMNASSALNGGSGHVVLFDHWVDGHSSYFGHEFGGGASPAHHVIPFPYFPSDRRIYRAYHYPKLSGSYVPPPYLAPVDPGEGAIIGIPSHIVYNVAGTYTWTKPATGTWVKVRAVGGGGGGGTGFRDYKPGEDPFPTYYLGGGGGGGAGYVEATRSWFETPDTVTVHVGHGDYDNPGGASAEASTFHTLTAFSGVLGGMAGNPGGPVIFGSPGSGGRGGGFDAPLDAAGWTGTSIAGSPGNQGHPDSEGGAGGSGGASGSAGLDLPDGVSLMGGGGTGGPHEWTRFLFESGPLWTGQESGTSGIVVVSTGGDRPGPGPDLRPPAGDVGNTEPPPPSAEPLRYLRMNQRNDGMGISRHARLAGTGANNPSSRQSGRPTRVGTSNVYL